MSDDIKIKKRLADIKKPYTEFAGQMTVLRKKQSLILKNYSQKVAVKEINQIKKNLSK